MLYIYRYRYILYIVLAYQKYLHYNQDIWSIDTKITYKCMYIYNTIPGQQRSLKKKKFTRIQTPLTWLQQVKPGILVKDLEYQSPSLNCTL